MIPHYSSSDWILGESGSTGGLKETCQAGTSLYFFSTPSDLDLKILA